MVLDDFDLFLQDVIHVEGQMREVRCKASVPNVVTGLLLRHEIRKAKDVVHDEHCQDFIRRLKIVLMSCLERRDCADQDYLSN